MASDGYQLVPVAALKWLNGEGPDPAGFWFGDFPEDHPQPAGAFWWRKQFADIIDHCARIRPLGEAGDTDEPVERPADVQDALDDMADVDLEPVEAYIESLEAKAALLTSERDAAIDDAEHQALATEQSRRHSIENWKSFKAERERAEAAESSLAAEKQRVVELEADRARLISNPQAERYWEARWRDEVERVAALEGLKPSLARCDDYREGYTNAIRDALAALRPAETGEPK